MNIHLSIICLSETNWKSLYNELKDLQEFYDKFDNLILHTFYQNAFSKTIKKFQPHLKNLANEKLHLYNNLNLIS